MTFEDLQTSAIAQHTSMLAGDPPDIQMGCDALIVAMTLFAWIAQHCTEAQHVEIAAQVTKALDL